MGRRAKLRDADQPAGLKQRRKAAKPKRAARKKTASKVRRSRAPRVDRNRAIAWAGAPIWQPRVVDDAVVLKVKGSVATTTGTLVYRDANLQLFRHLDGGKVVGYVMSLVRRELPSGLSVPRVVAVGQGVAVFFTGIRETVHPSRTMQQLYEDRSVRLNGFSLAAARCCEYLFLVRYSKRTKDE